jgi:hypothetical protein
MKKIALLLLLPALLAGCDSPNDVERPDVELAFAIQRLQNEPPFLVLRTDDDITIRGVFEALCTPYVGSARAEVSDGILTLHVAGRAPTPGCWDAVVPMAYQAKVADVAEDVAYVRVIHEWPDANRQPVTVYSDERLEAR